MPSRQRFYESDITRILRELTEANPAIEESQHRGRAMFWDKTIDFDAQRHKAESEVPARGYTYDWYSPQPRPMPPRPEAGPTTD